MLFVLQTRDGGLWAMPDEKRGRAYFERPDVEAGDYLFFADDGSALTPIFETDREIVGVPIKSAHYVLVKAKTGAKLGERAAEIRHLENDTFAANADVLEYLRNKTK